MLSNTEQKSKPEKVETGSVVTVQVKPIKPVQITSVEFFQGVAVNHPEGVQAIVTAGSSGAPNDHNWCKLGTDFAAWGAAKAKDRKPAYLSMSAFNPEMVARWKGRDAKNVIAPHGFWIDIEGSAEKYAKPGGPAGCYPDGPAVMKAVGAFTRAVAITPNFLVSTGSGGVHLHYVLSAPICPAEWLGRAKALVVLAAKHGLKIDAQCTTDAARIMRAPGSLHQKTGNLVLAYRWRVDPYTLDEWDRLTYYEAGADVGMGFDALRTSKKYDLAINGDVVEGTSYPKYSYLRAGAQCGAMNQAAQREGRDTAYPVWMLAVKAAALATEGREFAHSSNHPPAKPEAFKL